MRTPQPALSRFAIISLALFTTLGCHPASVGQSATRNSNVITAAEIEQQRQAGVRDLYELVQLRRPRWLQLRTDRSLKLETTILVYHGEARLGGVEVLQGYALMGVSSLRYLDAAQAGLLPGAGSVHVQGAIVITMGQ
jgi:hypothetical protein